MDVVKGSDELVRGTRIKVAPDSHERPMHCHHEKLVVIDGEAAFVGGIDLTERDRGEPLTHGLVELQATSRRSERLLGPLQALLVDG